MRTLSKIQTTLVAMIIMVILPFTGYAGEGKIQIGQTAATTFPITISQSGSYILTSNLTVATDVDCIVIAADNVTLDLNGFALIGPGGGTGGNGKGIYASYRKNITIQNGTVRDFKDIGIGLRGDVNVTDDNHCLKDLHLSNNYRTGTDCEGAIVTNCNATRNGGSGFYANGSSLNNCIASYNNQTGFIVVEGNAMACMADNNILYGYSGNSSNMINCRAESNDKSGFLAERCTITNCNASFNSDHGFEVYSSTITNCTSHYNNVYGFKALGGSVTNCTAYYNDDTGIFPTRSRIEGNDVRQNGAYGINAYNDSSNNYIIKNTGSDNGTNNFRNGGTNNYMPICGVSTSDNCNYSF